MEIKTKLGSLIVEESGWSVAGWPGFKIYLDNGLKKFLISLIEVDQADGSTHPVLKTHTYSPKEDYAVDERHYMKEDFDWEDNINE